MRISDWSSDVCSSDLSPDAPNECRASPARTARTAIRPTRTVSTPAPAMQLASGQAVPSWSSETTSAPSAAPAIWKKEIGRASWWGRVGQYVLVAVGADHLNKKHD